MLYLILLIIILIFSIYEMISKKCMDKIFKVIFLILSLLNIFRFGVGTDYFLYMYLYKNTPKIMESNFWTTNIHGEIGYRILVGIAKQFNISYTVFMFIIGFCIMSLFYIFINKNSKLKVTSTLILYCNMYYFVYINSGIRQALTIGVFLAILIPLLKNKKYVSYIIITMVMATIHTSILISLVLLLFKNIDSRKIILSIIMSLLIGIIGFDFIKVILPNIYSKLSYYLNSQISILAILSRIIFLLLIMFLFKNIKRNDCIDERYTFNYYIFGIILYLALIRMDMVASRMNIYFKAFEIILIPNLLKKVNTKQIRVFISGVICILLCFLWWKDIMAILEYGRYYNKKSVTDYKYISIFNKRDIYNNRIINFNMDIYE